MLNNQTPFEADSTWVRGKDGAEIWLVAVKGTFRSETNGCLTLDAEQDKVSTVPEFHGDPMLTSLLFDTDLVQKKIKTDVFVHGHAIAPAGRPIVAMEVRLRCANIDKTLRVVGDRQISLKPTGLCLTDPKPFVKMPIHYERSFGGTDQRDEQQRNHGWEPRNPVGVGFAMRKEHIKGTAAPNIERPGFTYAHWQEGEPVGFGPVARHWSPRVALAGTYDEYWERTRKPLVPTDFNDLFFQCAPADQQIDGFLKGGESVLLDGMTIAGEWSFHLPKVDLLLTTYFYDGSVIQHEAVVHTLILYPDNQSFQIVWHSSLPCHHKVNQLKATLVSLQTNIELRSSMVSGGSV